MIKSNVIKDATRGGRPSYGIPKGHMARAARENPKTATNPLTPGANRAIRRQRQSNSNAQANLQVRRDYDKGNVSQRHPAIAMPKGKPNSLGPKQTTGTAVKHVVIKDAKDGKRSDGMPEGHMARVFRENPITAVNPSTLGVHQAIHRQRQSDSNAQANLQVKRDYDKGNVSQRHPAIATPKGKPNSLGPKQTTGTAVKHVVIKDTKDEKAFARQVASDNVHRGNRGYKPQASVTVQKKN